jgi:hypothetical protein
VSLRGVRLTRREFEAALARTPRLSERGREAARAILVEREFQADVARRMSVSPQQVNAWVKRVYTGYQRTLEAPLGWRTDTITLPPEDMRQVKELEYRRLLEYHSAHRNQR